MKYGKLPMRIFDWNNKPLVFQIGEFDVQWVTSPQTDLWQKTYYGFSIANAPLWYYTPEGDFTFSVCVASAACHLYDQAGLVLMSDEENWVKASVEYENQHFGRLGSVVSRLGYSDWASVDIPYTSASKWFRISRLANDFLLEYSDDGFAFFQMRMFHMPEANSTPKVGVYACSPGNSSFNAHFSDFRLSPTLWTHFSPIDV